MSSILPKMQECFSAPKIDWHLPKTWMDVLHSLQNCQEERKGVASLILFACSTRLKGCGMRLGSIAEDEIFQILSRFASTILF